MSKAQSMRAVSSGLCVCGSGALYAQCCGQKYEGKAAPTAEALMRSRYTAYVLNLNDYLLATWHSSTRPTRLDDEQGDVVWLGLSVKRSWAGVENEAFVEFVAQYKVGGGRAVRLHEVSRFVREGGHWFYVDGVFPE